MAEMGAKRTFLPAPMKRVDLIGKQRGVIDLVADAFGARVVPHLAPIPTEHVDQGARGDQTERDPVFGEMLSAMVDHSRHSVKRWPPAAFESAQAVF